MTNPFKLPPAPTRRNAPVRAWVARPARKRGSFSLAQVYGPIGDRAAAERAVEQAWRDGLL